MFLHIPTIVSSQVKFKHKIDGLMEKTLNSIANTSELSLFCMEASTWYLLLRSIIAHGSMWHHAAYINGRLLSAWRRNHPVNPKTIGCFYSNSSGQAQYILKGFISKMKSGKHIFTWNVVRVYCAHCAALPLLCLLVQGMSFVSTLNAVAGHPVIHDNVLRLSPWDKDNRNGHDQLPLTF